MPNSYMYMFTYGVGLCVVCSTEIGNAKASMGGMDGSTDSHAFHIKIAAMRWVDGFYLQ